MSPPAPRKTPGSNMNKDTYSQRDLIIVNPGSRAQVYGSLGSSLPGIEPPIWAALTAAFARERGYSVSIIDAEAENLSPEETAARAALNGPMLVNIMVQGANPSASSTPKMTAAGEIARALREKAPDVKIAFSGLHPSALPERTLQEEAADYVCQGEGFQTIVSLLDALKSDAAPGSLQIPGLWYRQNQKILSNPPAPLVNTDELPMAAWDLLPMDRYRAHNWHCFARINERQPYAVIYTSLGCPFHCTYCNIHALYNGKPGIRFRSAEKVVEEIDLLVKTYQVKNIKILDELFAINEDRVAKICDLIIRGGYDLNMWAYARVDTVSGEMLAKMKRAGINWVAYGFESASSDVRQGVTKRFDQEKINRAVAMTQEAGINIIGNFIFGLPDDSLETMQQTLKMAQDFNFEYVNFYTAMAYPGSQLYLDSVREGVRLPETWHGYGQYAAETLPLPTRHLSAAEVLRFRDKAFREYFSSPRYLQIIEEKFGRDVVSHVKGMLRKKIVRKYA